MGGIGLNEDNKTEFIDMTEESGLTLVELLVAIVFTSAVLMIASTMIIQSFDIFFGGTERMTASQTAEMTVSRLANDIRASEEVSDFDVNDEICIGQEKSNGPIKITIGGEEIEYKFEYTDTMSGTIERDGRTIAHNVEKLCVNKRNNEDEKPKFKISLTYVDRDGVEKDRSTTVRRRNVEKDDDD